MRVVRAMRDPQRGNSLVLAMIVMTALGTLSTLTVFSVRGGIQSSANDRFHSIAQYAAESGGAAAMDHLRTNIDPVLGWSNFVSQNNSAPPSPAAIVGNNAVPGNAANPFSLDLNAYYKVEIFNNRDDPGFGSAAPPNDTDKRVIIRSTGYGPNGSVAVVEWEILASSATAQRPCPSYGQKNESEDNSTRNDCLGTIDTAQTATFVP
jgi:hypothetical protein